MNAMTQPSVTLLVTNVQILESGLAAQSTLTVDGGTIGSDAYATWRLKDTQGKVKPLHCEVMSVDGAFCVKDLCGDTYVNGSHMPLGRNQLARLEDKDEVTVGPYQLRVLLDKSRDSEDSDGPLDAMFKSQQVDLLADEVFDDSELIAADEEEANHDPLAALDALVSSEDDGESLLKEVEKAPDSEQPASLVPQDNLVLNDPSFTPQADSEYEMTSSIRLKKILGFGRSASANESSQQPAAAQPTMHQQDAQQHQYQQNDQPGNNDQFSNYDRLINDQQFKNNTAPTDINTNNESEGLTMDENVLDLLEEEVAKSMQPATDHTTTSAAGGQHLLTGPMLQGLGIDLSENNDMERMHMLSHELGESLQACVKGLLQLHEQVSEGRFGTMNRNLQPIEDNPLRLGLNYPDTIRTMYDADKSLVHLSAPAAISESLKNVRDHNEAMQHATTEALSQILNAFSPQVLLRRFNHYKRNSDNQTGSDEAWAWNMYCNYYQELTSNRQRGFDKLFWEIFEQAYDKKIREKQLEL